ncbi:MAG: hypothetical protein QXO70_03565 [Candidatus Pacearchaeota archaeon]
MANTKSIQKILDFLKTKKGAVSLSEICLTLKLNYRAIKEILEILKINNQVIMLTSEKGTTLVKLINNENKS